MERGLRVHGSDELENKWKKFRKESDVFEEKEREAQTASNGIKIDEWGFCISEALRPNSIFFLGLNPSAPGGDLHASFGPEAITDRHFRYQRAIARELGLNLSWWDIFPVRQSKQLLTEEKFSKIAESGEGRDIIRDMLSLTRNAIEIARPRAICICNSVVRNLALGVYNNRSLASLWEKANPLPLSQRPPEKLDMPDCGKKLYFTATTGGEAGIPVVLGCFLGSGYHHGEKQVAYIVERLKKALA